MIPLVNKQYKMFFVEHTLRIFYLFLICNLLVTGCKKSTLPEMTVEDLSRVMKTDRLPDNT